jgi:hypothetical protein
MIPLKPAPSMKKGEKFEILNWVKENMTIKVRMHNFEMVKRKLKLEDSLIPLFEIKVQIAM